MKKVLMLAALVIGSMNSYAAFIQCAPDPNGPIVTGGVAGATVFTCSPGVGAGAGASDDNMVGDGFNVTGVRLAMQIAGSTTGGTAGLTYSLTATASNASGLTNPTALTLSCVGDAFGGCSIPVTNSIVAGFNAVGPIDVFAAFTVTVTGSGTAPLVTTAQSSLFYEVTASAPQTGVPEPSTMALLGSALVGLGLISRRKK